MVSNTIQCGFESHPGHGSEGLWRGNREGPLWRVLVDPEHVLRAAWRTRGWAAQRAGDTRQSHPGLPVVRLRCGAEVETRLATLSGGGRPERPR
jgi:hypothetical protein